MPRNEAFRRLDRPTERVRIAEYAVTDDGTDLTTSGLGSCVGVALYDGDAGVGGLLHAMLPTSRPGRDQPPGKFVDEGVPALLAAMRRRGASTGRVRAKLAGGSEMFEFTSSTPVGERNVEAATAVLDELGVTVAATDVGGDRGRSLRLIGDSGTLVVRTAGGDVVEL
ncbi:MAG: chemotaxis protein CheD [Halarchaeum sp.]